MSKITNFIMIALLVWVPVILSINCTITQCKPDENGFAFMILGYVEIAIILGLMYDYYKSRKGNNS